MGAEASPSLVQMYGYDFAKMMTKNFERITERDIDAICHACCHYDLRKLLPIKPIIVGLGELSSTPLAAYLR